MLYGIGIDLVEIPRFKKAMERWGEDLYARLFTRDELSYCMRQRYPEQHLAARFAGKMSFFKAVGARLPFKSVEVLRDASGRPYIKVAQGSGLDAGLRFNISISHFGDLSIAETLVEKEG